MLQVRGSRNKMVVWVETSPGNSMSLIVKNREITWRMAAKPLVKCFWNNVKLHLPFSFLNILYMPISSEKPNGAFIQFFSALLPSYTPLISSPHPKNAGSDWRGSGKR